MKKVFFALSIVVFLQPAFGTPKEDRSLTFPRAHGFHPDSPFEIWQIKGEMKTKKGKAFGLHLIFIRRVFHGDENENNNASSPDYYLAQLAISDETKNKFLSVRLEGDTESNTAGASPSHLKVWVGKWRLEQNGEIITISAQTEKSDLALTLEVKKPPAIHGKRGLTKRNHLTSAYYYSLPLLTGTGTLKLSKKRRTLTSVTAWMDHEYFMEPSAPAALHGEWVGVHLDTNEELMLYQLRHPNGARSMFSFGSIIRENGSVSTLMESDFSIQAHQIWTSSVTQTKYPLGWTIRIEYLDYRLNLTPTGTDREVVMTGTPFKSYWSGPAKAQGFARGKPIRGNAFVVTSGRPPTPDSRVEVEALEEEIQEEEIQKEEIE